MSVICSVIVNKVDPDVNYQTTPADYVLLDLPINDYLIWTAGSTAVADGEDEPSEGELNAAGTIINPSTVVEVSKCLVFDKSEGLGTLRQVQGMNQNKRYVFGFSFDGATASEPQLEAWDNTGHDSIDAQVLGAGTPANSMLKGICTTNSLPGAGWVGSALAGVNVLLLNDGNGALPALPTMITSQELYCNLKIRIPAGFSTPAIENFIVSVRYTWS